MIGKPCFIDPEMSQHLKRLAISPGVSEAEGIGSAIDQKLTVDVARRQGLRDGLASLTGQSHRMQADIEPSDLR